MPPKEQISIRLQNRLKRPLIKTLLYVLKVLITAYILYIVFKDIDLRELLKSMLRLPLWMFIVLCGGSILRHWAQLRNWRHALSLNPSYKMNDRDVLKSYLIGLPLRFAVPGGPASLGKVFWVDNSSHMASVLAFGIERGFLTWATWSFASGAALFYFTAIPLWLRVIVFTLCLAAPVLGIPILKAWPKGRQALPAYKQLAPRMALLQVGAALIAYSQYWLILNSHIQISWPESLKLMSLTNFSNSIPITLAGLGLRESFAVHFLGGAGFSAAQAISTTLTLFVIQDIIPALIGLVVFLTRNKPVRV